MSAALVNEAKKLYDSGKTPYGPFTYERVTRTVTPLPMAPSKWYIRDRNGARIATVWGSEETARMFAALPEFLDPDLGAQPVGDSQ